MCKGNRPPAAQKSRSEQRPTCTDYTKFSSYSSSQPDPSERMAKPPAQASEAASEFRQQAEWTVFFLFRTYESRTLLVCNCSRAHLRVRSISLRQASGKHRTRARLSACRRTRILRRLSGMLRSQLGKTCWRSRHDGDRLDARGAMRIDSNPELHIGGQCSRRQGLEMTEEEWERVRCRNVGSV